MDTRQVRDNILKLIVAKDISEDKKVKKIVKFYKDNPQVMDETFALGRTIFHTIVKKNCSLLLRALLKNKDWHKYAMKPDKDGLTILHYCAESKDIDVTITDILLHFLPELINTKDGLQRTPLHLAISSKYNLMIERLNACPAINRSSRNADGQTAFELASKKESLKLSMLRIDLSAIKSIGVRNRSNSSESIESLRSALPLLSSSRSESSYSSSFSSSSSSSSQGAKSSSTSLIYDKMSVSEGQTDEESEWLANEEEDQDITKELTFLLTLNGLTNPPDKLHELDSKFYKDDVKDKELMNFMWLLVGSYDEDEGKREFSLIKEKIKDRTLCCTLGILSKVSLQELLNALKELYPYFDYHQKLVANYVASKLIQFEGIDKTKINDLAVIELKLFLAKNIDNETGLGVLGEQINRVMDRIIGTYAGTKQLSYASSKKDESSFDDLVSNTLKYPREQRSDLVKKIANALRSRTLKFYRDFQFAEFNNCGWTKPNAKEQAPNITATMRDLDRITYYFVDKILNQPANNVVNVLELLVDITKVLCLLCKGSYPDLHHAVMLSTVFNNSNVARLTNYFSLLSKDDNKVITELEQMSDPDKNFNFMRLIEAADPTALQYVGKHLMHLIGVNESEQNENSKIGSLNKVGSIGSILLTLTELKLRFSGFKMPYQKTDLSSFLDGYKVKDEQIRDEDSNRLQPRKLAIVRDATLTAHSAPTLLELPKEKVSLRRLSRTKSKMFLGRTLSISKDSKDKKDSEETSSPKSENKFLQ